MPLEIQRVPPTRFPVCPDCGHEIDAHAAGCTNRMRGQRIRRDEFERMYRSPALDELAKHGEGGK